MYSYACNNLDSFSLFLYQLCPNRTVIVRDLATKYTFSRSAEDLFYEVISDQSSLYEYRKYTVTSFYIDIHNRYSNQGIILCIRRK